MLGPELLAKLAEIESQRQNQFGTLQGRLQAITPPPITANNSLGGPRIGPQMGTTQPVIDPAMKAVNMGLILQQLLPGLVGGLGMAVGGGRNRKQFQAPKSVMTPDQESELARESESRYQDIRLDKYHRGRFGLETIRNQKGQVTDYLPIKRIGKLTPENERALDMAFQMLNHNLNTNNMIGAHNNSVDIITKFLPNSNVSKNKIGISSVLPESTPTETPIQNTPTNEQTLLDIIRAMTLYNNYFKK